MIPNWNDRPVTVSNLLNPAFCGEVLRLMIKSYEKETGNHVPFELLFLVLPLVLHKKTRESLPASARKNFYEWLEENTVTKINLNEKIQSMVPYTREAILFLIYHDAVKVSDCGKIEFVEYRKSKLNYLNDIEIKEIFNKSLMLGKWFGKSGNTQTIYASIGIKP